MSIKRGVDDVEKDMGICVEIKAGIFSLDNADTGWERREGVIAVDNNNVIHVWIDTMGEEKG